MLNKGAEKFIFRYEEGNEGQLLDAFVASATNPQTDFDWFDAAVLSFKLTQSLIGEADEILYKDLNDPVNTYHQEKSNNTKANAFDLKGQALWTIQQPCRILSVI
jgi:hypothetical protein